MIFKTSKKIYAHIDCDSFFASCEVFRNPQLEKMYVCVGTEIIVAATYNAKRLWIKTGTPIWEAKRILGNKGVFLKPDMWFYGKISKRLMTLLREETCNVEVFSVDEAFVELTGIPEYNKMDIYEYVEYLQKRIKQDIWVPVSIGVSNTRIKAKIFSKVNKPYGNYVWIDTEQENLLFQKLPIKDIPFIGKGYQERLKYKAVTIYDYKKLPLWELKRLIGKNATQLWFELNGVSSMSFRDNWKLKSISRTRSFNKMMTRDKAFLWKQILMNTERIFEELTIRKYEVRNITLQLKTKEWENYWATIEFEDYTYDRKIILKALDTLLTQLYNSDITYRKTWIFSTDIRGFTPKQLNLLDIENISFQKQVNIEAVLSSLNMKYWKSTVQYWG